MIPFEDYKYYYTNYINRVLGVREQEFDIMNVSEEEKRNFFNYATGTKILLMVAFIESNFIISSSKMKKLRKFEVIDDIPNNIHPSVLSSFIYIRDCIAHNPRIELLPPGDNTDKFLKNINEGKFHFAEIQDKNIIIKEDAIQYLHLIVREFFELQIHNKTEERNE